MRHPALLLLALLAAWLLVPPPPAQKQGRFTGAQTPDRTPAVTGRPAAGR